MVRIGLSVVIPVYHGAEFLSDLVAALAELKEELDRTQSPILLIEAILVDDEAIDGSPEVVDALEQRYPSTDGEGALETKPNTRIARRPGPDRRPRLP